ncbi:M20 family peptidase [Thalassotalea nanhaiensis]|uniref:M20 family peptidase n=1 Tax=Thalassotalea nanhaiensis TaxID=3065648 RepID=A0ABY9TIV6_9GAMM|nr:M20 family peptidase [Colwelliaceae bacterium SQ345]
MKTLVKIVGGLFVVVIAVGLYRANTLYTDSQYYPSTETQKVTVDVNKAVDTFSKAIQIATISNDYPAPVTPEPFLAFHQHLIDSFPAVHSFSSREIINNYSLVYKFAGTDESLKPILYMGHMDVVPVDQDTLDKWSHAPFSGTVADGKIWGRGAIDDKSTVMALMEAMELTLKQGVPPKRTLYFAFGHDEEIGGSQGAKKVAEYFQQQGVSFEFVLDEGGLITEGMINIVDQPLAIIGIAEKGFMNIRLIAERPGGHSSMPPENTGPGILAQAIVKLEENKFPATVKYTNITFDAVGSHSDLGTRFVMANQWLTEPLILDQMLKEQRTAAGVRTTTAVTMLKGSSKSNILPTKASAVANFRILPGETTDTVLEYVKSVINDDRISYEVFMANNPSKVSSTESLGYKLISQTIREFANDALVAPYLVMGGTDSKYFYPLTDSVYRFLMMRVTPETMKIVHGIDEHISIENYIMSIQYFHELLRKSAFDNEAPK